MNRISVVIPCYNQGNFVLDALQSCAAQTHQPDEIIVVNDGSDASHSAQIEAAIAACPLPIRYLPKENGGAASARNAGWRASSGDFVQFLDADDVLLPSKIERCLREFEAVPDAGVVYTDYENRTADLSARTSDPSHARAIPGDNMLAAMLAEVSTFFGVGCALIRRDWLERAGGFVESLRITEDWYMWVALASHGARFQFIPEALFWYRITPAGVSRNPLNMAFARLKAYEALRALPIPPGTFDLDSTLADRHHMLAVRLWEAGRAAEARAHFRQAIALHPKGRAARRVLVALSYATSAATAGRVMRALTGVARRINGPR